jgi:hypothetical protein
MGKSESGSQSALKQSLITRHFKGFTQGLYGCQTWLKMAFYLTD